MAKTPTEIRSLARGHTAEAINCLVGIMRNGTNESAKVSAAEKILDRGWGKAVQALAGPDGEGPIQITEIQLVALKAKDDSGED